MYYSTAMMYVCVYVSMRVCMFIYMYVCMYVCTYTYMYQVDVGREYVLIHSYNSRMRMIKINKILSTIYYQPFVTFTVLVCIHLS